MGDGVTDEPMVERLERLERTVKEQRGHIVGALRELGIPGPDYPAPVANAVAILTAALAPDTEGTNDG